MPTLGGLDARRGLPPEQLSPVRPFPALRYGEPMCTLSPRLRLDACRSDLPLPPCPHAGDPTTRSHTTLAPLDRGGGCVVPRHDEPFTLHTQLCRLRRCRPPPLCCLHAQRRGFLLCMATRGDPPCSLSARRTRTSLCLDADRSPLSLLRFGLRPPAVVDALLALFHEPPSPLQRRPAPLTATCGTLDGNSGVAAVGSCLCPSLLQLPPRCAASVPSLDPSGAPLACKLLAGASSAAAALDVCGSKLSPLGSQLAHTPARRSASLHALNINSRAALSLCDVETHRLDLTPRLLASVEGLDHRRSGVPHPEANPVLVALLAAHRGLNLHRGHMASAADLPANTAAPPQRKSPARVRLNPRRAGLLTLLASKFAACCPPSLHTLNRDGRVVAPSRIPLVSHHAGTVAIKEALANSADPLGVTPPQRGNPPCLVLPRCTLDHERPVHTTRPPGSRCTPGRLPVTAQQLRPSAGLESPHLGLDLRRCRGVALVRNALQLCLLGEPASVCGLRLGPGSLAPEEAADCGLDGDACDVLQLQHRTVVSELVLPLLSASMATELYQTTHLTVCQATEAYTSRRLPALTVF